MSKYVSLNKEKGFVNYEELVKFLAKCLPNQSASQQQQQKFQQVENKLVLFLKNHFIY